MILLLTIKQFYSNSHDSERLAEPQGPMVCGTDSRGTLPVGVNFVFFTSYLHNRTVTEF